MPAQRQDPAARPAHVAQQQLDDRRAADVLHADRVVGPADRVDPGRGPVPTAVAGHGLADLEQLLGRDAADVLDQFRGVAGVVPLEHLEDGARVLQRLVPLDLGVVQRGAVATELVAGTAVGRVVLALVALAPGSPAGCSD